MPDQRPVQWTERHQQLQRTLPQAPRSFRSFLEERATITSPAVKDRTVRSVLLCRAAAFKCYFHLTDTEWLLISAQDFQPSHSMNGSGQAKLGETGRRIPRGFSKSCLPQRGKCRWNNTWYKTSVCRAQSIGVPDPHFQTTMGRITTSPQALP